MLILRQKTGNIATQNLEGFEVDYLYLQWYETGKRILHKTTASGVAVALKRLDETTRMEEGDVLWMENGKAIVVTILPCDVIQVTPADSYAMACVCYEIGNKHLPLYYEEASLLIPFDLPLFRLLESGGYAPQRENKVLHHPLQTSVAPHAQEGSPGLLSRILQRTSANG
jgi:urease accessory protein